MRGDLTLAVLTGTAVIALAGMPASAQTAIDTFDFSQLASSHLPDPPPVIIIDAGNPGTSAERGISITTGSAQPFPHLLESGGGALKIDAPNSDSPFEVKIFHTYPFAPLDGTDNSIAGSGAPYNSFYWDFSTDILPSSGGGGGLADDFTIEFEVKTRDSFGGETAPRFSNDIKIDFGTASPNFCPRIDRIELSDTIRCYTPFSDFQPIRGPFFFDQITGIDVTATFIPLTQGSGQFDIGGQAEDPVSFDFLLGFGLADIDATVPAPTAGGLLLLALAGLGASRSRR